MSLTVVASITRTALGLTDLDLNDHTNYVISDGFDAGAVSWRREQAESPYVESKITIGRVRDIVEARIGIQVRGATHADIAANVKTLIDAFTQDVFYLSISLDGTVYRWEGEAADYTMEWNRERLHNKFPLMAFGFLRHPVPTTGPI